MLRWLADEVPDLAPLYEKSVQDGNGDLPYVVFESSYMRWFKDRALRDSADPALAKFLACVETALAGPDDEIANLFGVGFSEHLCWGGDEGSRVIDAVTDRVGPATRADMAKYRST